MFNNKVFYHGITRKAIVGFGVLFNSLNIRRLNNDGSLAQTLRVPLTYAAKNKMISRIIRLPVSETAPSEVTLPRMSFEVIDFEYDPARKINLHNPTMSVISQTQAKRAYGPVPYNLKLNLYVYVKNQDDGLQIFEQIVPQFNPDFTVPVDYIPELGIKHDLPYILDSVSYDDSYEGDMESHRMIVWTYTFTARLYYYGPVETQGIIRTAIVNVFKDPNLTEQTYKYTVTTNPADAAPGSDYTFMETFEEN